MKLSGKSTIIAAFGVVAATTAFASSELGKPAELAELNVSTTVQMALDRNPLILTAKEKRNELDATKSNAVSQVFPTITSTLTALHRKDPINIGNPAFGGEPYNTYDALIKGSQPLYAGGALTATLGAARKGIAISDLDLEIAQRDLTVSVLQSFYSILLNQEKLQILERNAQVDRELLVTAEKRYKIGRGQLVDVLQIKTQNALLNSKIADAKNQVETAAAALASVLGEREAREVRVTGSLEPTNIRTFSKDIQAGKHYRILEFERIKLLEDQTEDKNTAQMAVNWPQLAATGTVERTSYVKSDLFNNYSTAWTLGLQLTVPMFSGLSSVSQRRILASQYTQLQISESLLRDQISLAQTQATKNLETSRAVIESSEIALKLAKESLEESRKDFRLSTIDYLHFLTAEQNLLDAESAYRQAQYDHIVSLAKFMSASGYPLADLVTALNSSGK